MNPQLLQPVEDVWHHHLAMLEEALDESIRSLLNLLRLDEYHRHGHETPKLAESVGPFGSSSMNLDSLSEVLGQSKSSRAMSEARLERINKLLEDLEVLRTNCVENPDTYPGCSLDREEPEIHADAEKHLNEMANLFAKLRKAQLEIHSKYNPSLHDERFSSFNWRDLSPSELSLCPPFIVEAKINEDSSAILRKAMSILESRKPIKVIVFRSSLKKQYSPTANPICPATLSVEMVPLAMRGVYFMQGHSSDVKFPAKLFEALASPRPTLISLMEKRETEDEEAFAQRTEKAVRAKAFPAVVYDPEKTRGFVSCFDLSGNTDESDTYSFADYAFEQPEFKNDFSIADKEISKEDLLAISEYLDLARHQRTGKHPFITHETDGNSEMYICSQAVATQMSDLKHLWQTLKEIAGVDNPYVKDTQAHLSAEFGAQQKSLLASLQKEMEETASHREQVAVANAVRQIVSKFTGVDASHINLQGLVTTDKG